MTDPSSLSYQQCTMKTRIILENLDFVYAGTLFVLLVYNDMQANTICIYGDQRNTRGGLVLRIRYYVKKELRSWCESLFIQMGRIRKPIQVGLRLFFSIKKNSKAHSVKTGCTFGKLHLHSIATGLLERSLGNGSRAISVAVRNLNCVSGRFL